MMSTSTLLLQKRCKATLELRAIIPPSPGVGMTLRPSPLATEPSVPLCNGVTTATAGNSRYLQPVEQPGDAFPDDLRVVDGVGVELVGEREPIHHHHVGVPLPLLQRRHQAAQPRLEHAAHLEKNRSRWRFPARRTQVTHSRLSYLYNRLHILLLCKPHCFSALVV